MQSLLRELCELRVQSFFDRLEYRAGASLKPTRRAAKRSKIFARRETRSFCRLEGGIDKGRLRGLCALRVEIFEALRPR
jgi:hypothetical protein